MNAALASLIDALAEQAAQDYLRQQVAQQQAFDAQRTNPVPLPAMDQAA